MVSPLKGPTTIKKFCDDNKISVKNRVFVELDSYEKKSNLVDVILQDKVSYSAFFSYSSLLIFFIIWLYQKTKLLYTGPTARQWVMNFYDHREGPDPDKWRVFVLCKFDESRVLNLGTKVLHQVCCGYSLIDCLSLNMFI